MIIYMATNKINGKQYIGQTINSLEQRRHEHVYDALRKRKCTHFHRAMRKYGIEMFSWETLTECDNIDDLNKMEIYYIDLHATFRKGYNLTVGGKNASVSDETKRKMSETHHGKIGVRLYGKDNHMFGKKHSEETRKKMSIAKIGKKLSEETKRKISELEKGKEASEETKKKMSKSFKGRTHSEETKKKMSKAAKGRKASEKTRKKMSHAVVINNKYFDAITEAGVFLKVTHSTVRRRILNEMKWLDYHYAN